MLVAPVGLAVLWSLALFAPDDVPAEVVNRALEVAGATTGGALPQSAGVLVYAAGGHPWFSDCLGPEGGPGELATHLDVDSAPGRRIAAVVRECYRTAHMRDSICRSPVWIHMEDEGVVYDAAYIPASDIMAVRRRPPAASLESISRGLKAGDWAIGHVPRSFTSELLRVATPEVQAQLRRHLANSRPRQTGPWVAGALALTVLALGLAAGLLAVSLRWRRSVVARRG